MAKRIITVHDYIRSSKRNIHKNFALLSLNQLAMYFLHKMMVMSRIYEYDYPGLYQHMIVQIIQACTFPILPGLILPRFKLKPALFCGSILYMIFLFMQYFNLIGIRLLFALLMALPSVIIRVIQQIYIIRFVKIMCKVTGSNMKITLVQILGIFLFINRSSEIISYIPAIFADQQNVTHPKPPKTYCGIHFVYGWHGNVTELSIPPQGKITQIASLSLIIVALFASVIALIFLKPLQKLTRTELNADPESRSWMSTVNFIKTLQLCLIIPMTLFSGFEQAFLKYDFLMAYVVCNKNRYDEMDLHILETMLACQALLSIAPLLSTVNIEKILLILGIFYLITTLVLLTNVNAGTGGYLCISGIWNVASCIWDCLIQALYGVLFPKNELEAYAQMGLWYSIGIAMSILLTLFAGIIVKLWFLLILLLLSIITIILLPFMKSGLHNKVDAAEMDITLMHREIIRSDWDEEERKMQTVSFRNSSESKVEYSIEIKSFFTMKYHHIHILKEREDFTKDLTEQEGSTIEAHL